MTARTTGTFPCPRCGEALPAGSTRCDACGAYLVPAPDRGDPAARPGTGSPRRAGSGGPFGSAWIFLALGLLAGGAVGYVLRGAVGPRAEGGPATGPADVMRGAAEAPAAGAQMPPQVMAMVEQYRAALAKNPADVEANIGFGNLLFDSGQWERAIEHYQRALDKTPGNPDVRVDMAIAYHSLGQNERARKEMERVTREQSTHKNAWLNLGVVSAALGDRAAAIRAWERYLSLDPNGAHATAVRAQIEELRRTP